MSASKLPSFAQVQGADLGVLYGLIAEREPAADATFEHAWERDLHRRVAVDTALERWAKGRAAPPAPKPRWLDGLVQREFEEVSEERWPSEDAFIRARLFERLGVIDLELDDTYVRSMIGGLARGQAEALRADPELLARAFWRIFQVEGNAAISLANLDRHVGTGWRTSWRSAVLELVADGTIDRSRVLDDSLRALGRDFSAYRAGWFRVTFLALDPSVPEIADLQPQLRRLLRVDVPATVGLALDQLRRLEQPDLLEVAPTVASLGAATLVKPKGIALAAVRLAQRARERHPAEVSKVALIALGHPHPEVQSAAADLLRECGLEDRLHQAVDLAPSVRADLGLPVLDESVAAPRGRAVQPLRPPAAPVTPGELTERIAALLEEAADPPELEVVLAALASPGSEEPLAPLVDRARKVAAGDPSSRKSDFGVRAALARTILGLLGESAPRGRPRGSARRFLFHRLNELRRGDGPLLATPDLPGGFVSATALVDRWSHTRTPRHHDVVAALLRLHPDDRARSVVPGLPPAVRFALDGDKELTQASRAVRAGADASWWIAAQRSRAPYDETERPVLRAKHQRWGWPGHQHRTSIEGRVIVRTSSDPAEDRPTELGDRRLRWGDRDHFGGWDADWIGHVAAIWPHDAEHFLAFAVLDVLEFTEDPGRHDGAVAILDALSHHPGRMGDLADHALAAGLSAASRNARAHAVDAFADLVPSGRIATANLAAVLARHAEAWPATRWAKALTECSQVPGVAPTVIDLVGRLLPQLPPGHRGLCSLLGVLREESLRTGRRVDDPELRAWLAGLSGGSAAARTARALLA